jgi:hypothetical protein
MFVPANRNEWTSIVRPPADYRLECALGTSFGLDFTALTALLLAMLDQPAGEAAWDQHARRLQAITALDERVRVVVHRGQIRGEVAPSNRVFALLDRIVDEVHVENASFHPKVWVIKYVPRRPLDLEARDGRKGGPKAAAGAIYRFLCTSRNLTLSSCWEAVARLDGDAGAPKSGGTAMGADIAAFLQRVLKGTDRLSAPLRALLQELPRVDFSTEGSKVVRSCAFFWQWPGERRLIEAVDRGGRAALIVSPFVKPSALKALAARFKRLLIISRQEELDAFWDDSIEKLIPRDNVWVVRADAAEEGSADGDEMPSLELHAKLLFCEYPGRGKKGRTEAWLGSANASPRGWGLARSANAMNCEAMIRIVPGIRPEHFLEQFACRDGRANGDEEPVLNGWIERYQPRRCEPKSESQKIDDLLDEVKQTFASLSLSARLETSPESMVFVLHAPDRPTCLTLLSSYPQVAFQVVPLGLADSSTSRQADFATLAEDDLRFEGLSIGEIGSFLLVRLTHRPSSRYKDFVLRVELNVADEIWAERRAAFLKANLSPNDFRLFLRSILFEGEANSSNGDDGKNRGKRERPGPTGTHTPALFEDMTIEDILHACTQDRGRIEEVDRLLKLFEGTTHVDPSFRAFWANFHEAVRAVEKGKRQ